jgi:hypothetical protein
VGGEPTFADAAVSGRVAPIPVIGPLLANRVKAPICDLQDLRVPFPSRDVGSGGVRWTDRRNA